MEEDENVNTTGTATGANATGAAQTTPTTQTTQTAQTPVVPDGYVPATEVETERTARTMAENARTEAETARVTAEARATAAETLARSTEIRAQAIALGFNDPSDAAMFVGADVELEKIGEALAEVLKTKSYLAKSGEAEKPLVTPTSPTNPARTNTTGPIFTQAQIGNRAFWHANKDAIQLAMREGRIQG